MFKAAPDLPQVGENKLSEPLAEMGDQLSPLGQD